MPFLHSTQVKPTVDWMKNLPLFWGNKYIFVSHAGISNSANNLFDADDSQGIL
jgi:serine/threonine protein phosphatase 1